MSDEIKEILDKFNKTLENYELDKKFGQLSVDSICHLFPNEQQLLLDYITNLQQEKERLRQQNFNLIEYRDSIIDENREQREDLFDYKSRVEKAIEYNYELQERYCHSALFDELVASKVYEISEKNLNILQGGKDDSNLPTN